MFGHIDRTEKKTDFWMFWVPMGLPVLIGILLGLILAYFISYELYFFAAAIVASIPAGILLLKKPFSAVLIWLLISPFLQSTISVMARYMFWLVHRALVPVALGITILSILLLPEKRIKVTLGRAELSMVFFVILVTAGVALKQSNVKEIMILFYDRVFVSFCLYLLVRLTAPDSRWLHSLTWISFFTVLVQVIIGLLSWFVPQILPIAWLELQGARTVGTLRHPTSFGTTLLFCMLLLYQGFQNQERSVTRVIFIFGFCVGAVGVFLSFTRGVWLGGLVCFVGLVILYPRQMIAITIFLFVVMLVLGGGLLAREVDYASDRLQDANTTEARVIVADAMLRMILHKPFFGWGYESSDNYVQEFFQHRVGNSTMGRDFQPSHNTYLTILSDTGLSGFFLYMFPVFWWFFLTIRIFPRISQESIKTRHLLISFWIILGCFFIPSNFSDMRFWPISAGLWWLALGWIANVVFPYLKPEDFS